MINSLLTRENTVTTTPTTCPAWCEHGAEPADHHHGVIRIGPDDNGVDVFLTRLPSKDGTGVVLVPVGAADTIDEGGGLDLDPELTAELARVLVAADA
jgi:hypothetical protein